MTLRKTSIAALAALAAFTGGIALADTAAARHRQGGASFSFSFGNGPAYGYGAPYGYQGGGYRYAAPRHYRNVRPYYAPPRYGYRYPSRYRACDRWMWDGWRQTYVLVRGRC